MAEVIFLNKVRASFPHLAEPHAAGNSPTAKKQYGIDLIVEPNSPGWAETMERVNEIAREKWSDQWQQILAMINQDRRLRFYGKGDEKINKTTLQPYNGYAGNYYISCKRDTQPQMIKQNGQAAAADNIMELQAIARTIYGGCYVNAAIRPWPQDNQHGRAIRCELIAVQFDSDGEAFGAGNTDASNMFGAVKSGGEGPSPGPANPFDQAQAEPPFGMPTAPFEDPKSKAPDWM